MSIMTMNNHVLRVLDDPSNCFSHTHSPIYNPTTASLAHKFIYGFSGANHQNRQFSAPHTSPSATFPHTSDTNVLSNTWWTSTLLVSRSPAFPPLASATQRLAATHVPFKAPLPSSFPAHVASPKTVFNYTVYLLENFVSCRVSVDFATMNTASPPSNRISIHGAHDETDNQLLCHRRHSNNEHDVPADKKYTSRRHTKNSCATLVSLADVA